MGTIRVEMGGSFESESTVISAEEGGHANAIQRAIAFLNDRLPLAIEADHRLETALCG